MFRALITSICFAGLLGSLQGCSSLIANQTANMADDLSTAIYNSNDVDSVGQAIPTFLLVMDSMVEGNPDSAQLLKTAAQLNDAYAGVFVPEPERQAKISQKSLDYAWRALCAQNKSTCEWSALDYAGFEQAVAGLGQKDLPYAYTLAVSWLNWIRTHSDNWNAIAELPRSEAILRQVVVLDDTYEDGMAHLYLGGIATLLPPALGGKPEQGRAHFERAIEISQGNNMMVKVVYAQQYARMLFDQELHHRLLTEVVTGDPNISGYVLINTVAQEQAAELLASESDYF
jgi:hypothetical protein